MTIHFKSAGATRKKTSLPKLREIEEVTAATWVAQGTITVSSIGNENTYYVDQFDNEFFCKNYPR
jgi:hypothetical protein